MAAKRTTAAAPAKKADKPAKKAASKKPAVTGDSKLAKFLSDKKLDQRRVLVASHTLESLRREDRDLRLARKRAKGGEGEADKKAEAAKQKPRSGRPVTPRAMHAALTGGAVSGPTKTRILRAVNHLLEQKKQE